MDSRSTGPHAELLEHTIISHPASDLDDGSTDDKGKTLETSAKSEAVLQVLLALQQADLKASFDTPFSAATSSDEFQ